MPFAWSTPPATPVSGTDFVSQVIMTRAQLKAQYPAGAAYLGKYARVSDLWTSVDEVMRCSYDGVSYYWRPQRSDYAMDMATASGAMSLIPMQTPPTIKFTATLLGGLTLTPTEDDVWPGCFFDITAPGSLGIFSFTIGGLVGGVTKLLLGGGNTRITYSRGTGWRA